MTLRALTLLALVVAPSEAYHFLPPGTPAALAGQVVISGAARFTVLTKHLIRLVSLQKQRESRPTLSRRLTTAPALYHRYM